MERKAPSFVVDGDTLYDADGAPIRIAGFDAPEMGRDRGDVVQHADPGAHAAKAHLAANAPDLDVSHVVDRDQYGRQVAVARDQHGRDYGVRAVEEGVAFPHLYTSDQRHRDALDASFMRSYTGLQDRNQFARAAALDAAINPRNLNLAMLPDKGRINRNGVFADAVGRGTDNLQASLYAAANALGELTGVDTLAAWGEEGVARNLYEAALHPARVEQWDDVDSLAAFGTKVLETVGEQVPNIASMIASGGLSGAGAKMLVAGIGKTAVKRAAIAGAATAAYPMHVGEMQLELMQAGIDKPGTGFITAIPNTILDVFGLERMVSTVFRGLDGALAKDLVKQTMAAYEARGILPATAIFTGALAREGGKGMLMGAVVEAPTEMLQEMVNITARAYHDPTFDIMSDEVVSRLREAFISGGVAGGVFAGGGRVITTGAGALRETGDDTPASNDTPRKDPTTEFTGAVTTPEPQADINAQAIAAPALGKPVYDASGKAAIPEGTARMDSSQGGQWFVPRGREGADIRQRIASIEAAVVRGEMSADLAHQAILNYAQSKEEAATGASPVAVVAHTPDGAVAHNELVDSANPEAMAMAMANAQKAADATGGTVQVESPETTLADRVQRGQEKADGMAYTPLPQDQQIQISEEELRAMGIDLHQTVDPWATPAQQAPAQQAPVQQAPVQQAPVQQAPVAGYLPIKMATRPVQRTIPSRFQDVTEGAITGKTEPDSPWLLADGHIIDTHGDHIDLTTELGYEGYTDFQMDSHAIRATFIPAGQQGGKPLVSLHLLDGQRLTSEQHQTVKRFVDAHGAQSRILLGVQKPGSDGLVKVIDNPEYQPTELADLPVVPQAPTPTATPVAAAPTMTTAQRAFYDRVAREPESFERDDPQDANEYDDGLGNKESAAITDSVPDQGQDTTPDTAWQSDAQRPDSIVLTAPVDAGVSNDMVRNLVNAAKTTADTLMFDGGDGASAVVLDAQVRVSQAVFDRLSDWDKAGVVVDPEITSKVPEVHLDFVGLASELGDADTSRKNIQALAVALRDGYTAKQASDRLEFSSERHPVVGKDGKIRPRVLRMNPIELVKLGQFLSTAKGDRAADTKADFLRALSWLAVRGITPKAGFNKGIPAEKNTHLKPVVDQLRKGQKASKIMEGLDDDQRAALKKLHAEAQKTKPEDKQVEPTVLGGINRLNRLLKEAELQAAPEGTPLIRLSKTASVTWGDVKDAMGSAATDRDNRIQDIMLEAEQMADSGDARSALTEMADQTSGDLANGRQQVKTAHDTLTRLLANETPPSADVKAARQLLTDARREARGLERRLSDIDAAIERLDRESAGLAPAFDSLEGAQDSSRDVDHAGDVAPESEAGLVMPSSKDEAMVRAWETTKVPKGQRGQPAQQGFIPLNPKSKPMARLAALANEVLARVGITPHGHLINSVDDAGFQTLREVYTNTGLTTEQFNKLSKTEQQQTHDDIRHNSDLLEQAAVRGGNGWITFLRAVGQNRAVPVIYIRPKLSSQQQAFIFSHELGHLVMYYQIATLGKADVRRLRETLGGDTIKDFNENFANAFAAWALNDKQLKDSYMRGMAAKDRSWLDSTITKIVSSMRKLYRSMRDVLHDGVPKSFNQWMKGWMDLVQPNDPGVSGIVVRPPKANATVDGFADFTPPKLHPKLATQRTQRMYDSFMGRYEHLHDEVLKPMFEKLLQANDSYLRDAGVKIFGGKLLADFFHRRPGTETTVNAAPIEMQQRMEFARHFHPLMEKVLSFAPKYSISRRLMGKEQVVSPEWKQAQEDLLNGRPPSNEVGRAFRGLFDKLHSWQVSKGIRLGKLDNYFTTVYSAGKLSNPGQYQAVRRAIVEGVQEYNSDMERAFQDPGAWTAITARLDLPDNTPLEAVLIKDAEQLAERLYNKWTNPESSVFDPGTDELLAPGVPHSLSYKLPEQIRKRLQPWREDDLIEIATRYTNAAIKRGVWQERFGLHDVLADIDNAFRTMKPKAAHEFKQRMIDRYQAEYGVNIYDPSAGLIVELKRANLPEAVYDRVMRVILPGYMGRLGANMNATLKKMSAMMIAYQNWRLLPLSVLSQFIDLGVMMNRTMHPFDTMREFMKVSFNPKHRKKMREAGRMIGAIEQDVTAHILNDQAQMLSVYSGARKANELLFRLNGMHGLTNLQRMTMLSMGKRLFESWHRTAEDQYFRELGTTREAVGAWLGEGMSLEYDNGHNSVLTALNQFIDEGVIRPTPASRPGWGNDQRAGLIFHLKGFMWAYHETVLRLVGHRMDSKKGLAKALPLIMLASLTLPLAAAGMELRWLISPPKQEMEFGSWDYMRSAIERAGVMGVWQLYADMEGAESVGQLSVIAALGPTVSQMSELVTRDLSYSMPRALPLYSVLRGMHHWGEELTAP